MPDRMTRKQAAAMAAHAASRLAELDELEEAFGSSEPPEFSVIRMRREINGYPYDHAIIRAGNGQWYASGARSGAALEGLDWEDLLDWLAGMSILHIEVILPQEAGSPPSQKWQEIVRRRRGRRRGSRSIAPGSPVIEWTDPADPLAPVAYGDGDQA